MILITGGTGILGSHLLYYLASNDKPVRALKRENSDLDQVKYVFEVLNTKTNGTLNNSINLFNKIEWVEGDVLDIYSLEKAYEGIKEVYHCAGMVSFKPSERSQMMQINVGGTTNMVNLALDYPIVKFCHVSSIAAIGRQKNNLRITENTVWKDSPDNTNYANSKHQSEIEVWRAIAEGLNAVIVNPSVILGFGHWGESSNEIITRIWNGLKYYSEGKNGFVDARDVAKAMINLMESKISNERFIISSENYPFKDLFNDLADNLGKKKPYINITPLMGELGWRLIWLKNIFSNDSSSVTKETVRSVFYQYEYANQKIKDQLGIDFLPIKNTIEDISKAYLLSTSSQNGSSS